MPVCMWVSNANNDKHFCLKSAIFESLVVFLTIRKYDTACTVCSICIWLISCRVFHRCIHLMLSSPVCLLLSAQRYCVCLHMCLHAGSKSDTTFQRRNIANTVQMCLHNYAFLHFLAKNKLIAYKEQLVWEDRRILVCAIYSFYIKQIAVSYNRELTNPYRILSNSLLGFCATNGAFYIKIHNCIWLHINMGDVSGYFSLNPLLYVLCRSRGSTTSWLDLLLSSNYADKINYHNLLANICVYAWITLIRSRLSKSINCVL